MRRTPNPTVDVGEAHLTGAAQLENKHRRLITARRLGGLLDQKNMIQRYGFEAALYDKLTWSNPDCQQEQ